MQTTDVTVIGLGLMGHALAAALLASGRSVTVWNRTPGKADDLEDARRADTIEEAVAASELVVVCVSDFGAVAGRLGEAVTLVNLSSGTSQSARDTAEWAPNGLDGAIMAAPDGIGTAGSTIVYSGDRAAFERHEATFGALGEAVYLGEDHALAALHEMAVVSLMWNMLNGFLHGTALLRAAGVEAASYVPIAAKGAATVTGWFAAYAGQVDAGDFPPIDATVDVHVSAMEHLIEESRHLGVGVELPEFLRSLMEGVDGSQGYAALVERFGRASSR
ncbi:NAD(P)-binding domain-containing protein [Herbidospora sp. NBRC 101105]|uniref:NAD(P)-dependent oxidoreductase n=1 Tax=Herbidospora sp. NBRC 101105 TaxID=3032195 RepID=UPI0024A0A13D|nr:NAD(P)-binding domain-containing protein [Herbidospora sp. NBRC 101105]GLX99184.1 3-hydroxyisobutyrate dehydrogenase [Herbidospora sp. NBRC 101105]